MDALFLPLLSAAMDDGTLESMGKDMLASKRYDTSAAADPAAAAAASVHVTLSSSPSTHNFLHPRLLICSRGSNSASGTGASGRIGAALGRSSALSPLGSSSHAADADGYSSASCAASESACTPTGSPPPPPPPPVIPATAAQPDGSEQQGGESEEGDDAHGSGGRGRGGRGSREPSQTAAASTRAAHGEASVSYTSALALGILLSAEQRQPLKTLYAFAARHAVRLGLRDQPNWRRSVRNTLSKQRGFVRVDATGAPAAAQARRCLWAVAEPNLPQPTRMFLAAARAGNGSAARIAHLVAAADSVVWPYPRSGGSGVGSGVGSGAAGSSDGDGIVSGAGQDRGDMIHGRMPVAGPEAGPMPIAPTQEPSLDVLVALLGGMPQTPRSAPAAARDAGLLSALTALTQQPQQQQQFQHQLHQHQQQHQQQQEQYQQYQELLRLQQQFERQRALDQLLAQLNGTPLALPPPSAAAHTSAAAASHAATASTQHGGTAAMDIGGLEALLGSDLSDLL